MAEIEECTHNCETCGANCASREGGQQKDMHEPVNDASTVKRVIGIVSGKGGVGKSIVTSLMAVMFSRKGYSTAILDADITGPSIPKAFGIKERAMGSGEKSIICLSICLPEQEMYHLPYSSHYLLMV